jgi:Uma2 family endonuclease
VARAGIVLPNSDCVLSFFDVVEPDIVVVRVDRFDLISKRNIKGAPTIVIEVLSPGTSKRDRTIDDPVFAHTLELIKSALDGERQVHKGGAPSRAG